MINLFHELQEVETILKHLAMGAYQDVADLITKIRVQTIPQVQALQTPEVPVPKVTPVVDATPTVLGTPPGI
jgi:hypothetical protein